MNRVDKLEILMEELADSHLPLSSMHRVAKLLMPEIRIAQVSRLVDYYRRRKLAAPVADSEIRIEIIAEWLRDNGDLAHQLIVQEILRKPASTDTAA